MSWLFSQALVAEYSAATCSGGTPSVLSSTTSTQRAYCAPDKMTECSRLSRFGMMYEPLTEDRGEALLTWYLAGFHAKTFQLQERVRASTESEADSGQKWRGLLAKYDPVTHSLKTAQCSLFEDSTACYATLPRWGSLRNGGLYQQPTPALRTNVSEFGSSAQTWATPTTMDSLPPKSPEALLKEATVARPGRSQPANLRDQVSNAKNWPTPAARDYKGARMPDSMEKTGRNADTNSLPDAVEFRGETGRLNPVWVEWLMGWPQGWTDLKPLAMDRFREWQQQHSIFCEVGVMNFEKERIVRLRLTLEQSLSRENYLMLLLWCDSGALLAQRAGARLSIAEMLHKKIMPHVPIEFLFSYAIPVWLGVPVKNTDLDVWAKTFDFDHKQVTVRLQGIHQLLDAWLSTARSAANDVIASHQYEQASTEVADYVA